MSDTPIADFVEAQPAPADAISFHPLAEAFPLLGEGEFAELADDIRLHGLREPITLYHGAILDGRNRYRACKVAGVKPLFDTYSGGDAGAFVISANLRRRHMDASQRALAAAWVASLPLGANQHSEGLPIGRASELLNVSETSVARARKVLGEGAPELVAAVARGEVAVSTAAEVATMPKAEQVQLVARGEKEILAAAKQIKSVRAQHKATARGEKEKALGAKITAMPTKRYGVIYADPPWRFEPYSRATGMDRAADNHYPTMSFDKLAAMTVPAADDCVLFLWATLPMLQEALDLMRVWRFSYKSACIWTKDKLGTGYWFRNRNEILLVGSRGRVPAPAPGAQSPSMISAPVREHSAKPAIFREVIENMFPTLPKLEMFARGKAAPGWDVFGLEAES